ncbi:MAG: peptidylprolyl isomerase [Chloroflexota bacterium]|nr:peptidylprolyl isomerase [Chloroflexota bacterium]
MRQRRRALRGQFGPTAATDRASRQQIERSRQRLIRWGVLLAVLAVAALLIGGYYWNSVRLPNRVIAEVGGEVVRLGDLPPSARIMAAQAAAVGGAFVQPEQVAQVVVGTALLRQVAPGQLAVTVTPDDVSREMVLRFDPGAVASAGGGAVPTELGQEAQELYDGFLESVRVSDAEYRAYVEGELYRRGVTAALDALTADEQEAVLLDWIITATSREAQETRERLDAGEEFAAVAADLHTPTAFEDTDGRVGWVPRGAFPEFDETMFGAAPGDILGPLLGTQIGSVVLRVADGPAVNPIEPGVKAFQVRNATDNWFRQQWSQHVFDYEVSEDSAQWLADNL